MTGKDIILGLLLEESRSGYELNHVFESVFSHFYKTSYGMIYPTLKKLLKDDLVKKEVVVQDGKPNKNIFSITDKGKKQFEQYLHSEIQLESRESEFMVRMYFGAYVQEDTLLDWLKQELEMKKKAVEQLKEDYTDWHPVMEYPQEIIYEIGVKQYLAEIEILENKINEITNKL